MYILGVDVGGMSIKVGVVSENGELLHKFSYPTDARGGNDKIAADIALACRECVKSAGLNFDEIGAVGLGVPGTVRNDGVIAIAPNIFMTNYDLSGVVSAKLCKPVFALNDANSAAFAEAKKGAGAGYSSSVLLTFGTGIGMGIVLDGRLWAGANGAAGEVGHLMLSVGGKKCNCGSSGCYERYGAATALIEQTAQAMNENKDSLMWSLCDNDIEKLDGSVPFLAAKRGDECAIRVLDRFTDYVAGGLLSVLNLLDPEVVIIGGGLSNAGDDFILPVAKKALRFCMNSRDVNPKEKFLKAALGNDAGIIGAALYAKENM